MSNTTSKPRIGIILSTTREGRLADKPAAGLTEIILDGVPGTAMPPWRPLLTRDEAAWIANYLKTQE